MPRARRESTTATARVDAALLATLPTLQDAGLPAGSRLLVGLSGGQDSLCLTHALWRLQAHHGWVLHVAYVDHGIRAESAAEAAQLAVLCERWALPFTVLRVDVPSY